MKDYANFTSPGDHRPGPTTRHIAIGAVVSVIALAVIGYFIFKKHAVHVTQAAPKQSVSKNQLPATVPPLQAARNESSFDFYDVLPQQSTASDVTERTEKWTAASQAIAQATPLVVKNTKQAVSQPRSDKLILEPVAGAASRAIISTSMHQTLKTVHATVPAVTTKSTHQVVAKTPKKPTASRHYLLQVGLFNDKQHAQQQRAELMLRGLDVALSTQITNHQKYYVLNMGPYNSRRTAQKHQLVLAQRQIHGKIIIS